jgi:hypothetical protein
MIIELIFLLLHKLDKLHMKIKGIYNKMNKKKFGQKKIGESIGQKKIKKIRRKHCAKKIERKKLGERTREFS